MTGSNRRPPPCKGGALPAELITPAVWSRIIGSARKWSTLFSRKNAVRWKNSQDVLYIGSNDSFLSTFCNMSPNYRRNGVEELGRNGRMLATY